MGRVRRLQSRKTASWWGSAICLLQAWSAIAAPESVAFFYGANPPALELSQFEWVVLEPGHPTSDGAAAQLRARGSRALAYVSVGEVSRASPLHGQLRRAWVLGENASWGSVVMDPANEAWREALLSSFDALVARGYDGFFLDTLDSHLALADAGTRGAERLRAQAAMISELRRRHPRALVMVNRGFELLEQIAPRIDAVAVESVLHRWRADGGYEPVPEREQAWMLEALERVRGHGLPIVAIDYVAPRERSLARGVAARLGALGMIPWVTNREVNLLGVGALEHVPRKVLLIHDGARAPVERSAGHRWLALPLEHLGLVPVYLDARAALPAEPLRGRYAGAILAFEGPLEDEPPRLRELVLRLLEEGVRFAWIGHEGLALDVPLRQALGLEPAELEGKLRIATQSARVGFEAPPRPHSRNPPRWRVSATARGQVHLSVADASGRRADAVAITSWGGFAWEPHFLSRGYEGRTYWNVDPFAFLSEALALEPMPMADATTELGLRVSVIEVAARQVTAEDLRLLERELAEGLRRPLSVVRDGAASGTELGRLPPHVRLFDRETLPLCEAAPRDSFEHRSVSALAPLLAPDGSVYHPLLGPEGFARAATDPAWRVRGTIGELEWTASPRRLKPQGIYFPLEAGRALAGASALQAVLSWAEKTPSYPLFLDEYVERARAFPELLLARELDGAWRILAPRALTSLRLPPGLGWPDLEKSEGVVALSEDVTGRHLSVTGGARVRVRFTGEAPRRPHLASADAALKQARWNSTRNSLELIATRGARAVVQLPSPGCRLRVSGNWLEADARGRVSLALPASRKREVRFECP